MMNTVVELEAEKALLARQILWAIGKSDELSPIIVEHIHNKLKMK